MRHRTNVAALSKTRSFSLCLVTKTTQNFPEIKFTKKVIFFSFMEKHLSYNFHICKNAFHRQTYNKLKIEYFLI